MKSPLLSANPESHKSPQPQQPVSDLRGRHLRDLRLSVTDHCNLRCSYCLPQEIFGENFPFTHKNELLSLKEMTRLAGIFVSLGVQKIRITGGEPLLRKDVSELIQHLRKKHPDTDLALTTNGIFLAAQAQRLFDAGLSRINVSSDSLDSEIARKIAGQHSNPEKVWQGIETARQLGMEVKVNAVIQRGINETQILPLALRCRELGAKLRFIEFMDVGTCNHWDKSKVITGAEVQTRLAKHFDFLPEPPAYSGEVASRFRYADGKGEIGFINSISKPFCGECTRIRISAEGKLYTCLFAGTGFDLKSAIRQENFSDKDLADLVKNIWGQRNDRYSEERSTQTKTTTPSKTEMWRLGG
ncbi:MAG: GTP 3',8-cyclase MoaA [Chthoniobacterales bacterium]